MSTYWYLHCRTCNTIEHVGWWNHGVDRGLRQIRDALPALARLADLVSDPLSFVGISITGPEYSAGILDFAREHHAHDVVCKNEYGAIDGTCGARFPCGGCGASWSCVLPVGHDGAHENKEHW